MTLASSPDHPRARIAMSKRVFDLICIFLTLPLTVPLAAIVSVLLLCFDGAPLFYKARRAGAGGREFWAFKFRTMREVASFENEGVSGGNKQFRISKLATFLRRSRLDELPQLVNVLRGDMSLVGPRPPDPRYVLMFPEIYGKVLQSRPGLTGLATLHMHRFEERVLGECTTPEDTESVYCRRCIPRKAKLDLIYQNQQSQPGAVCRDMSIILQSIRSVLR